MRNPNAKALSGLWKALNAAEATPVGGDFDEEGHEEVLAAIAWLMKEQPMITQKPARSRGGVTKR